MGKAALCVFFSMIFSSIGLHAQLLRDGGFALSDSSNYLFSLQGRHDQLSNSFTREFTNKFVFGGIIDNDLKQAITKNLSASNSFYNQTAAEIDFKAFRDSSNFGFGFKLNYTQLSSINFTSDVFQSIFYGNTSFGSEVAILDESTADIQNYVSAAATLVSRKTGSYIGVGVYSGLDYGNYFLGDKARLTNKFETVDDQNFVSEICFETSNGSVQTARTGLGLGLIGGINFQTSFGNLSFEFVDLGWINWKDVETRDTTGIVSFKGISWNYGEETEFNDVLDQIVDSLLPTAVIQDKRIFLPTRLSFQYVTPIIRNFSLNTNLSYRFLKNSQPLWVSALQYHTNQNLVLWANLSITGGQVPIGYGVGTQIVLMRNTFINIESRYVSGIFDINSRTVDLFFQIIQRL